MATQQEEKTCEGGKKEEDELLEEIKRIYTRQVKGWRDRVKNRITERRGGKMNERKIKGRGLRGDRDQDKEEEEEKGKEKEPERKERMERRRNGSVEMKEENAGRGREKLESRNEERRGSA